METHRGAGWYPDPLGGPRLRYFDGATWTIHYSNAVPDDKAVGRKRRTGLLISVAVLLFFEVGAALSLWLGLSHLWGQLHGASARVDIAMCTAQGKHVTCTGTAQFPDGTRAPVYFPDGEGLHDGTTVDAHVQGNNAYVTSFPNEVFSVAIPLVVGCGCVVAGIMLFRSWRRDPSLGS